MTASAQPISPGSEPQAQFKTEAFVQWFRSAAPYINSFRDKTFVIAFGGEVVSDGKFWELTHDINLLAALDVRIVLVHGARPQVEFQMKERGIETKFVNSRRVTDPAALTCVMEACGTLRVEIEALFSVAMANTPMQGADIRVASGNFITAKPIGVLDGVDYMQTGEVRKIDVVGINRRLEQQEVVLLSPLGYSPTGEVFNLTMEDVATMAAIELKADKLIFLMDTNGVSDSRGKLLEEMTAKEAETMLAETAANLSDDARIYLPCAIKACKQGVGRTHLITRHIDGALLMELFSRDGIGTMITQHSLENLRQATIDDVGGLLQIIEPLEEQGILVKRGREVLETEIGNFALLEHDGIIIGCAALYKFPDQASAELACLAVTPDFRSAGRGERLLNHMEKLAAAQNIKKLFVLSTRTMHFFLERGFTETDVSQLPEKKQMLYNYERRSKIFFKALGL